ncbi:DUF177 domain-containing protein [Sphingomonas bacterium]|uniref:YceD family protein n=1 Tax=Sphingomonas bacterium TaxID=1895847 RepID=UPI001574FF4B|nr:DUF177 domain-containing protein [Sphingomonas bacterium]
MTPEFHRPVRIDTIGERDRAVEIEANEGERAALARRFGLVAVDRLSGTFGVRREGDGILASGSVGASVVQACSVTGDPIAVTVIETVALRFADEMTSEGDEVELSVDALDILPIEDGAVDLGEAAAETMALALDPFPRSPGAAAVLKAAGVVSEDEATHGPFADLKAKLGQA